MTYAKIETCKGCRYHYMMEQDRERYKIRRKVYHEPARLHHWCCGAPGKPILRYSHDAETRVVDRPKGMFRKELSHWESKPAKHPPRCSIYRKVY